MGSTFSRKIKILIKFRKIFCPSGQSALKQVNKVDVVMLDVCCDHFDLFVVGVVNNLITHVTQLCAMY